VFVGLLDKIGKMVKMIGVKMIKKKDMWVDYDQDADVLYLSFRKPQRVLSK
jgi:hypothetical protein